MYVIFFTKSKSKAFEKDCFGSRILLKIFLKKGFEETLYAAIIAFYACIFFYFSWWEAAMTIFLIKKNSTKLSLNCSLFLGLN